MLLLSRWQNALQVFGVDSLAANQAFTEIVAAYSYPSRHYHTLQHIQQVLNTIDTLQIYSQDLISVQLAAWLHDVVYDTHNQDNEEKSADYAAKLLLSLGVPSTTIANVTHLILQTKHHQADSLDSQVLLDADLAILAASPEEYRNYSQAIWLEYAWLSESEYIQGRKKVLQRFLQREHLYHTPLMCTNCEQTARQNIQTEINYLSSFSNS
jgi:predicted metal-dependent HD superfamily phosphohydrolase